MGAKVTIEQVNPYPYLLATDADRVRRSLLVEKSTHPVLANSTSSLKDEALHEYRKSTLTSAEVSELNDWRVRFEKSRPAIEQHLEKRVSYLFMQAVLCYQTSMHFREGHTFLQGMGATTLKYENDTKKIAFQGAHSATIPCLYADSLQTQREIVYLYRSGAYDESNATIDMVKEVNDADRAIDEKYSISLLRNKTIKLLNKASSGELSPEQVVKQFLVILLKQIDRSIQKESNPRVKEVLELYRERARLLLPYINQPEHIDRWLDLEITDPDLSSISMTVGQVQQQAFVSRREILKLIKKKIDELPPAIYQERHQKQNESHAPFHFKDLYYYTVLRFFSGADLQIVEEALGIQWASLQTKVAKFQKTGKTRDLLSRNAEKISALTQQVFTLTSHLLRRNVDTSQLEGLLGQKQIALRPGIYRLRYRMIRSDQEVQSEIKSKIESVLHHIKKKEGPKPHLDLFFYRALFEQATTVSMRTMLAKLLHISSYELKQAIDEIKVNQKAHSILNRNASLISKLGTKAQRVAKDPTAQSKQALFKEITKQSQAICGNNADYLLLFYKRLFNHVETQEAKRLLEEIFPSTEAQVDQHMQTKMQNKNPGTAEKAIAKNLARIQEITAVATKSIHKLSKKTTQFRHQLMTELRMSHGMSQDSFKALYKKKYPNFPMSDGTMHNLEHGIKTITPTIIAQLSDIFDVHQSLFYPSHFAEN